jgi:hypothetical protein
MPFDYYLGNSKLDCVNHFLDLGVTVNNSLTWTDHISLIRGKALRNLGFVKRTLGFNAPLAAKKTLYIALVRSIVTYCTQLWSPSSRRDCLRIEGIQRLATRYIINNSDISYGDRLRILNMIPLCYFREIQDLTFFYNMLHGRLDIDIDRYFTRNQRQNIGIVRPFVRSRFRTENARFFFTNRVLIYWDKLPLNIKSIVPPRSLDTKPYCFKRALYKYYTILRDTRFNVDDMCSWSIQCFCSNCRN